MVELKMKTYDIYTEQFWLDNPRAKMSADSIEHVDNYDIYANRNDLQELRVMPKFYRADNVFVYKHTNGMILEIRVNSNGNNKAAFFPNEQVWNDFQKPMSYTTYATR